MKTKEIFFGGASKVLGGGRLVQGKVRDCLASREYDRAEALIAASSEPGNDSTTDAVRGIVQVPGKGGVLIFYFCISNFIMFFNFAFYTVLRFFLIVHRTGVPSGGML